MIFPWLPKRTLYSNLDPSSFMCVCGTPAMILPPSIAVIGATIARPILPIRVRMIFADTILRLIIRMKLGSLTLKIINSVRYPPEYAKSSVVAMVPITWRPTVKPDFISSFALISGFFIFISSMAAVISMAGPRA